MPEVGETKQVLYKESRKHIWVKCPVCQQERWVQLRNYERGGSVGLCLNCFNEKQKAQKVEKAANRGKITRLPKVERQRLIANGLKDKEGYILRKLQPDDFFFPMAAAKGYVREHRLVIAKNLGRNLHRWEIVHHKNHNRSDNRLENLQLTSEDSHNSNTHMERRIKYLEGLLTKSGIKF